MNFSTAGRIYDCRRFAAGLERPIEQEAENIGSFDTVADELVRCVIRHVHETAGRICRQSCGLHTGFVGAAGCGCQRAARTGGESEDPSWIGVAGGCATWIVGREVHKL